VTILFVIHYTIKFSVISKFKYITGYGYV